MHIRVNWNQANWDIIRAHQIMDVQPNDCQFNDMKGDFSDFSDVLAAEVAMKQKGIKKYRRCSHCWEGTVIDLI
jgi:predicted N-acyltransferase